MTAPASETPSPDVPLAPPVRRLPTPRWEPPYDDEQGVPPAHHLPQRYGALPSPADLRPGTAVQGALALAFPAPRPTAPPAAARPLRLVPPPSDGPREAAPAGPGESGAGEDPAVLRDARAWAARFVQTTLEVLSGDRPTAQLVRLTNGEVYQDLHRRVTVHARRCPPGRTGAVRPVLRSVRASSPAPGVAEVCALAQRGPRVMAVALRLERRGGRWLCTALELG